MSNFLPDRIKNLRGWIPESDIDGIDLPAGREQFVSETENVVYENGFWRNEKLPQNHTIPFTLGTDESLVSATNFYHTDRGRVWVYVIYFAEEDIFGALIDPNIRLYVVDESGFSDYVDISSGIPYWGHKIYFDDDYPAQGVNFAEFDDALKINVENMVLQVCNAAETKKRDYQRANFSLEYIKEDEEYDYITGDKWKRDEGWYCHVRWLGSSYHDIESPNITDEVEDPYAISRMQVKTGEPGATDFLSNGTLRITSSNIGTSAYVDASTTALPVTGAIQFTSEDILVLKGAYSLDYIRFTPTIMTYDDMSFTVVVSKDVDLVGDRYEYTVNGGDLEQPFFDIPVGLLSDEDWYIGIIAGTVVAGTTDFASIDLIPISDYVVLSNISSQEANLLSVGLDRHFQPEADPLPMFTNEFDILVSTLDFDIRDNPDNWSIYYKTNSGNIYYKVKTTSGSHVATTMTIGGGAPEDALQVTLTIDEDVIDSEVHTLNSDYGLGASVVVFPIKDKLYGTTLVIGYNILSEIYYKNRSYVIMGDKNIYMSHIAGSGRLQPDTFAYSKSVEFGYIYNENSNDKLIGIATTPLDELLTLSDYNALVYSIQPSQSHIYRKLKAINGNVGLGSTGLLIRGNTGKPLAELLVWADEKGVYIYGGGVRQPMNVVKEKGLYNYWKNFYSSSLIGAYNPMRNEALFISGDLGIILDLSTLTWRKIRFPAQVKEFIGIIGYKPYFLTVNDTIIYLDDNVDEYMDASFVTHYTTNYAIDDRGNFIPLGDLTDKIMQEMYVSMHEIGIDIGGPLGIWYDIIADGNVITPSIYFGGQVRFEKVLSPLLIRYRQVKVRITILANNMKIKEVGFSHSIKTSILDFPHDISGTGFGHNFGNDFGVYL